MSEYGIIGTCSRCGGPVAVGAFWPKIHGSYQEVPVVQTSCPPQCLHCGAEARPWGPVIETRLPGDAPGPRFVDMRFDSPDTIR